MLDKHKLQLQLSKAPAPGSAAAAKASKAAAAAKAAAAKAAGAKLVVRNMAFEATRKDLMGLFGPFGHIKSCRWVRGTGRYNRVRRLRLREEVTIECQGYGT